MICCHYCGKIAELVGGDAIYPHRPDLFSMKFWRCAPCDAYVGCHRKDAYTFVSGKKVISDGTLPLGRLANPELRAWKQRAHAAFDPVWKDGRMPRRKAYGWLAESLGIHFDNCHIGEFDVDGCKAVISAVNGRAHKRSLP